MLNQQLILKQRPSGSVKRDDFSLIETPVPDLAEGQFLVRNEYISVDPAMRGWVNERPSYFPPVAIGAVMRGLTVGRVEASRHPDFTVGDAVTGMLNLQTYCITDGSQIRKINLNLAPASAWLGGLGIPGITAHFGLLDIGQPKAGDTVLVSAATGAVGSIVGQIAKKLGCRVIGIAGGEEKRRFLIDILRFDAALDYKAGALSDQLRHACPGKIDVYFDNVGGEILDNVLPFMKTFGRIPVCGTISTYNNDNPIDFRNFRFLLTSRLRMQGFVVTDYAPRFSDAIGELITWYKSGGLILKDDVRRATLADFSLILNDLFEGRNFGKLAMKISQ